MTRRLLSPPSAESVLAKALEFGVFAPVGVLEAVRSELPRFAERGRQTVEQRVLVGRFIATLLAQQARQRIGATFTSAAGGTEADSDSSDVTAAAATTPTATTETPAKTPAKTTAKASSRAKPAAGTASRLAIDHYESLSATQVIPLLGELDPEELEAIERFEQAHRNRRTVLGRIAQLRTQ
jgi:hypothetical protein